MGSAVGANSPVGDFCVIVLHRQLPQWQNTPWMIEIVSVRMLDF